MLLWGPYLILILLAVPAKQKKTKRNAIIMSYFIKSHFDIFGDVHTLTKGHILRMHITKLLPP
jgi:hypothetical protein